MGKLIIEEPLATQIRETAEQENMTAENLLAEIVKRARWEGQRNKIHEESKWWYAQPLATRTSFSKFVAVHEKEVVDTDDDEQTLIQRIRQKYGKTPVLITPSEEMREIRVVRFRLEPVDSPQAQTDLYETRPKTRP